VPVSVVPGKQPFRIGFWLSRAGPHSGVRGTQVQSDRENQRPGPRVHGIEQQRLVTTNVVGNQPDDEPQDRHGYGIRAAGIIDCHLPGVCGRRHGRAERDRE